MILGRSRSRTKIKRLRNTAKNIKIKIFFLPTSAWSGGALDFKFISIKVLKPLYLIRRLKNFGYFSWISIRYLVIWTFKPKYEKLVLLYIIVHQFIVLSYPLTFTLLPHLVKKMGDPVPSSPPALLPVHLDGLPQHVLHLRVVYTQLGGLLIHGARTVGRE